METVRIDKWLWAARFFKTRALASDACDIGRVESNGHRAKAARDVRLGDKLRITNEAGIFEIEVLQLTEVRGPAAVAQGLYRESAESRAARAKVTEERKQMLEAGGMTEGRPSKRDRRDINKLRGRIHRF
ncbi:RNA-binding S4 domain-containing protein [Granulicella aggregans]|jgi:ribosome-associated heat shock protein Hsp15|uniref:RNA-binding S4 domain-containing protein n=1 Tax=Granulicella aggregans TaxID=474949 RepID=UPI0021DFEEC9|nr:RNA-binding S4 domain-containing protein [Granulicella aggregans]